MLQKRYQYQGPNGICWTRWFNVLASVVQDKFQLDKGTRTPLRNEYRTIN